MAVNNIIFIEQHYENFEEWYIEHTEVQKIYEDTAILKAVEKRINQRQYGFSIGFFYNQKEMIYLYAHRLKN